MGIGNGCLMDVQVMIMSRTIPDRDRYAWKSKSLKDVLLCLKEQGINAYALFRQPPTRPSMAHKQTKAESQASSPSQSRHLIISL